MVFKALARGLLRIFSVAAVIACLAGAAQADDPADTRAAAEQGDAEAQNNLGVMYYTGRGVPQDYAEAVKWYRRAAEQGDADAQTNLGVMYGSGRGVPQDDAEAVKWLQRGAEQGDAIRQLYLALIYSAGRLLPQDNAEAVKWYRRAAEQGHTTAQYFLGTKYDNGEGVPQNYVLAHMWFNLAASQGDTSAVEKRDSLADKMPREQIAEAQRMATEWKPTAAGQGVSKDLVEIVDWYRLAAEQGNADAQYNLGLKYTNGEGVAQDYILAHMWFNLAAAQGNASATKNRNIVADLMTPAQIAEAQRLAREWTPNPE